MENTATRIKSRKEYVGYLNYDCAITNPDIYHQQLINEGYYENSKIEDVLKRKNINELKELLESNNLDAKGKKNTLIERLINNLSENTVQELTRGYYSLSEKGKLFFDSHQEYVEIHKHKSDYQINLEEYYNVTKNDTVKRQFNDVAWQIFNNRTLEYQKEKKYTLMRYNYYHMARLLLKENKREDALLLFLYCLVVDLSGTESISSIDLYRSKIYTKKEFLENLEYNMMNVIPIDNIIELKEYYNEQMLFEAYMTMNAYLPFNVSTIEFIKDVLNDALNSSVFNKEKYEVILLTNKKKKYLDLV